MIGSKPPHAMKEEDKKKPVKAEEMFIDIGATSREDVQTMGVRAGTPITSDMEFRSLVFTVQEEVGLKGGRTSAFGLDPDIALVWK